MRNPLGTGETNDDSFLEMLTDGERENWEKLDKFISFSKSKSSGKGAIDAEKEMVTKVAHDEEVGELKGRIESLEGKLTEARSERAKMREERDDFEKRFNNKCEELNAERESSGKLRSQIAALRQEKDDLKKNQNSDVVSGNEYRSLQAIEKELRGDLENSESIIRDLESKLSEYEFKVKELELLNASKESVSDEVVENSCPEIVPLWTEINVRRISPTTLMSDGFTFPIYKVVLSRDGGSMSIAPDVEGGAVCKDKRIELPRLSTLIPFTKVCDYSARIMDDGFIMLKLV